MMALVLTLCRSHNFSIAEALLQNDTSTDTNDSTIELLAMDNANVVCDGAISLQDNNNPHLRWMAVIMWKMWPSYERRNVERQNERNGGVLGLPRERLRDKVVDQGLKRPTPAS